MWYQDFASVISLVSVAIACVAMFYSWRASAAGLIRDRFEMFHWLESPITKDEIETARVMHDRYFPEGLYEKQYKNADDKEVRKYLMAFRIYHYILYSSTYKKRLSDYYKIPLRPWIKELVELEEFREVHKRWGKYYPNLKKHIDGPLREYERRRKSEGREQQAEQQPGD